MAIFERGADGIVRQVGGLFFNNGGGVKEVQSKYVRDKDGVVREIYSGGVRRVDFVSGRYSTGYLSPSSTDTRFYEERTSGTGQNNRTYTPINIPKHSCNRVVIRGYFQVVTDSYSGGYVQITVRKTNGTTVDILKNASGGNIVQEFRDIIFDISPGAKPFDSIYVGYYNNVSRSGYRCVTDIQVVHAYMDRV